MDSNFVSSNPRRAVFVGFVVVVLGFAVWLAWNVLSAKSSLEAVRSDVGQLRTAVTNGDLADARRVSNDARESASDARDSLHSIPCRIVAAVPFAGAPIASATGIADTASVIADDVLPPVLDAAEAVDVKRLRLPGGGLDVASLRKAQAPLAEAVDSFDRVRQLSADIPDARYVPPINSARATLRDKVSDIGDLLTNSRIAVDLMPGMLGADGSRNYVLVFQTNAELRGSGGFVGGSAMLSAHDGKIEVDRVGSNRQLENAGAPLDMGADFQQLYGSFQSAQTWQNSNISPNFPYAGRIWQYLLAQQSGARIDGAIAVDPVALSYLLKATGPVKTTDGESVTADNVVKLTEVDLYARYPDDQTARKAYLTDIASAVLDKLSTGKGNLTNLVTAVIKGVGEGRIALWSSHSDEQKILESTALGHATPTTTVPYANVTIVNAGPTKLDYYLRRELDYTAGECTGDRRDSSVRVRLTNTAPPNLPRYTSSIKDNPGLPDGTNMSMVFLYATDGAELRDVTINGDSVLSSVQKGTELGHPVFYLTVATLPNEPVDVRFALSEPVVKGAPQLAVQPLVDNGVSTVNVPECA